jgi:pimeloyl-ACP methyl ester carboxylesterase
MSKVLISSNFSLYFEEFGDRKNPTVVLIRGTGADSSRWMPQVSAYKDQFHVIIFDNRGVGKSDTPPGPYTVQQMADDTIALLNALEIESCHLSGSSLGGAIALNVALDHPTRIRSLQMHSSWLKTHGYMEFSLNLLKEFLVLGGVDFYYSAALPLLFSPTFLSADYDRLKSILAHMRSNAASPEGLRGQIEANLSHDLADRAPRIGIPTLVTVGESDYLLPVSASQEIVDAIPNSELVVFKNRPHLVTMESPEEFNSVTLNWMEKNCTS